MVERLIGMRRFHHLGDAAGVVGQRADVEATRAARILMQRIESGEVLLTDGLWHTEFSCQERQPVRQSVRN